jgi:hypothetical protein
VKIQNYSNTLAEAAQRQPFSNYNNPNKIFFKNKAAQTGGFYG